MTQKEMPWSSVEMEVSEKTQGVTLIISYIRRLCHFGGFKILNFNIFWGFWKNEYIFWGMKIV